jgi:hypothetical protein
MPPRFSYWTILAGGLPTAFREADRDELLPTFHRIKQKHPDAEMKWFARGKLWASPEEAQRQMDAAKRGTSASRPRELRGKDWRPGGEHRDPRQRFKDAQKQRNQDRRKERWEHKHRDAAGGLRDERPRGPRDERPRGLRDRSDRPSNLGPRGSSAPRGAPAPRERPHGDPLRDRQTKGSRQGSDVRPPGPDRGPRPRDERPWSAKPRSSAPARRDRQDRSGSDRAPRSNRDDGRRWERPRNESRRPPSGKFGGRGDRGARPPDPDVRGAERKRPPSPRPAPHGDKLRDEVPRRPFKPAHGHGRARTPSPSGRNSGQWEERTPPQPSRPPRPDREPRPGVEPGPEPPPRPNEPAVPPAEPPERGGNK